MVSVIGGHNAAPVVVVEVAVMVAAWQSAVASSVVDVKFTRIRGFMLEATPRAHPLHQIPTILQLWPLRDVKSR